MLKGIDENGILQNVCVSEDGAVKVMLDDESSTKEKTILSNIITIGTTPTVLEIKQKVSSIMIANYSETADITINSEYKVGANLAVELPINSHVDSISITSTEDNTKIQLVVKGVV